MTVPSRREAARLLLSLDPPAWSLQHACAVADVAAWIAREAVSHGTGCDVRAVEAAALLHDVDKIPAGHVNGLRHGDGSAQWLVAHGMAELAPLVRDHPVPRLADDSDAARLARAPVEAKIIAYADKRAGQRLEFDGRPLRVVAPPLPVGTRRACAGQVRPSAQGQGLVGRDGGSSRRPGARPGARGVRSFRNGPAGRAPAPLVASRAARVGRVNAPVIAYFRGGDGFALDRAVIEIAHRLERETGAAPDRWRVTGTETTVAQVQERVGTAPMFGGGCMAVVTDPGPLLRSRDSREALDRTLGAVAPGNALVFIEQGDAGSKRAAMYGNLEASVLKAGGLAREFAAPRAGQLAGWLRNLATDRGLRLERDAAEELARRVGGFVAEGDVDRQRQGALAAGELDKLAIYRGTEAIGIDDVRALVAEVIPDSTWAMLDAVAERRADVAAPLLDRLLETTPLPLLIVQLHRRLRELLIAADHAAAGSRPADIVKAIGGHPYRAQKLVEQARRWMLPELDAALAGVLDLDAMVKGAAGSGRTERQVRLAFALWIQERVMDPRRRGGRSSDGGSLRHDPRRTSGAPG